MCWKSQMLIFSFKILQPCTHLLWHCHLDWFHLHALCHSKIPKEPGKPNRRLLNNHQFRIRKKTFALFVSYIPPLNICTQGNSFPIKKKHKKETQRTKCHQNDGVVLKSLHFVQKLRILTLIILSCSSFIISSFASSGVNLLMTFLCSLMTFSFCANFSSWSW